MRIYSILSNFPTPRHCFVKRELQLELIEYYKNIFFKWHDYRTLNTSLYRMQSVEFIRCYFSQREINAVFVCMQSVDLWK